MSTPNISERHENQKQKQLSISDRTTHGKKYPFFNDISQLLHDMSMSELQNLCTLQEMLLAKSFWEATNYSGSLEKCKKRLTEIYEENWHEHVKLKDHFRSLRNYYIWVLLISHRQQWDYLQK